MRKVFLFIAVFVVLAIIISMAFYSFGDNDERGVHSRTFFKQFVIAGGPIVWFVLLPMSLVMVFLVVEYSLTICKKRLLPKGVSQDISETIRKFGPGELESQLADNSDLVSIAILQAVTKGKGDLFRIRSGLFESLQDQALELFRKIEWINLIGNVSPMVGLFGTVFGMIKLFNAIVQAGGQPQPAHLAGGISVALVTTFWGLFIAIPALTVHGIFRNRIEALVSEAATEAENIMPQIQISSNMKRPSQIQPVVEGKPSIREISTKSRPTTSQSLQTNK